MTFKEFLKSIADRRGDIKIKDVIKGLRWKKHPKAKEVLKDCKDVKKLNSVYFFHIDVFDDEYYDFEL